MASPAFSPEWRKRSVFVVTQLSPQQLRDRLQDFGVLQDFDRDFDFTTDVDDAEFVIFDFSHPPDWWGQYVGGKRWVDRWPALDPRIPIPFFFLGLDPTVDPKRIPDAIKNRQDEIRANMRSVGIELRIADAKKLIEDLRWFRCMLPFRRKPPAPELPQQPDDTSAMVLHALKSLMQGNA